MTTITEDELRALAVEADTARRHYEALGAMNAYHPDPGERVVMRMRYEKARVREERASAALYQAISSLAEEKA